MLCDCQSPGRTGPDYDPKPGHTVSPPGALGAESVIADVADACRFECDLEWHEDERMFPRPIYDFS